MSRAVSRFLFLLPILSFTPEACTSRQPSVEGNASSRAGAEIALKLHDGIGRSVTLPKHPLRIVSLAPSVTEVLYGIGANDRLIGVTNQCDWPADVANKPRIGDLLNPNYESILAAKPDLVIASTAGNDRAAVLKLADLGLPVFVTAPRSVDKILETIQSIGQITDCAMQANQLVTELRARLKEMDRRLAGLPPSRAFFITWFDPLLAPGKNTFENDVLRLAGVNSITSGIEEYYPRFSLEQILAQDPDIILTVSHRGAPLPDLRRLSGWQRLGAVRKGHVYVLSEEFQHPSQRFLEGVEELARKLHPERFQ